MIEKLFLSVGAMKAGTTFLYNVLRKHPDIYFSKEKELHYFAHTQRLSFRLQRPLKPNLLKPGRIVLPRQVLSNEYRRIRLSSVLQRRYGRLTDPDKLRKNISWYVDRFMQNPIDSDWLDNVFDGAGSRWCADFSNYNALLSAGGWRGVRKHCGQLRVMYVMREPIARCWSHMKFEMLPAGKRDQLLNGNAALVDSYLEGASSSHGRYRHVVGSLRRNLAPEELLILRLEDILDAPQQQFSRVTRFLDISDYDFSKINVANKPNKTEDLELPDMARQKLEDALASEIEFYNKSASA